MTQQATTAKNSAKGAPESVPPPASGNWWEKYVSEEHTKLDIDSASFKPELYTKRDDKDPSKQVYTGLPLKGFPLAYMQFGMMKEMDDNGRPKVDEHGNPIVRPALGYLWLLTGPLKTQKNGEPHESKPGDRIIVWGNAQMKQGVRPPAANHPSKVIHMIVTPIYKGNHPTKKNQTMWRFDFSEGSIVERRELPNIGAKMMMLVSQAQAMAPQLGQGAEDSGDEFPID